MSRILPAPIWHEPVFAKAQGIPRQKEFGKRILSIFHPPDETAGRQKYLSPDDEYFFSIIYILESNY